MFLKAVWEFITLETGKKYLIKKINGFESCEKENQLCFGNHEKIKTRYNKYHETWKRTDLIFKQAHNLKTGINQSFKARIVGKTDKIFELLGSSHCFFKKWITHQLYGDTTIKSYGYLWILNHCIPLTFLNLLVENQTKKCFCWNISPPVICKETKSKNVKINQQLYVLHEIKSRFFLTE